MKSLLLATVAFVSCQPASAVDEQQAPPTTPPATDRVDAEPATDLAMRFHMYRSFDLLRAIERLLVRGNLDDAQALATSIAESPAPGSLEPWGRQTNEVRLRAGELARAPGIDEACRRAARLAAACASCHLDTGAAPLFSTPPAAPPDRNDVASRMARHRWAADRLWEGMLGDADVPWRDGIAVLADTPLPFAALDADRGGLAKRLQLLADRAKERQSIDTVEERAQVYGELLVTCAACHSGASTTPNR